MAVTVREQTPTAVIVFTALTHISGVTYYISATINPILYSIMSKKFREAFKVTLVQCCKKNTLYDYSSSRYTSVLRAALHKKSLAENSNHNNGSIQYRDFERLGSNFSRTDSSVVVSSSNGITMNKIDTKVNYTELDLV